MLLGRQQCLLAIVVTLLGALALVTGPKAQRPSVLMLMIAGLTLIFSGAVLGNRLLSHWDEVSITPAGSCCMITAHRRNHTFCRRCKAYN